MGARLAGLLMALVLLGVPAFAAPTAAAADPGDPGSGWRSAPVASGNASSQPCASLMFVGVRGSGETAPYGTTVTGIRDGLASRWAGRGTVRQVWLDYPAADPLTLKSASMSALLLDDPMPSTPYFDSARIGAERLSALLTGQSKRCPKEWVVLAGFSQGAQAITEALARTDTSSRLAGAILAGNPDHHPGQNAQELSGTAPLTSIGLSALLYYLRGRVEQVGGNRDTQVKTLIQTTIDIHNGSYNLVQARAAVTKHHALIPATAYPNTYSVCLSGDPVCDATPAMTRILTMQSTFDSELAQGLPTHRKYTTQLLAATLDAVAKRANTVAAAASQGRPVPHGQQLDSTRTPRPAWGRPQILVAVGAGLAGLAIGIATGVLGHARRAGSPRHQKE
ncbi:MAG: cutinase family protein [Acidipropionibacterium sp.]|nr:cutinase family protein [Acidipropionibacterium sp.]